MNTILSMVQDSWPPKWTFRLAPECTIDFGECEHWAEILHISVWQQILDFFFIECFRMNSFTLGNLFNSW